MNMNKTLARLKTQKGIGLLELMLALAIIALLLIMATRYYQSTRENQLVSQGINEVNAVVAAANNWVLGQTSGYAELDEFDDLREQGLLPASFGEAGGDDPINAFGTVMAIEDQDNQSFTLSYPATETACQAMMARMNLDRQITATCDADTLTVVYSASTPAG